MTTYHETTQEEEAFGRFYDENKQRLSQVARTVIAEAEGAAFREYLIHNYILMPQEYEKAYENMRLAAAQLTDLDLELLKQVVRLLLAAASIDPFDMDTLAGPGAYCGELYAYYEMAARMVREVLYEEISRRDIAEQEPIDESDLPF